LLSQGAIVSSRPQWWNNSLAIAAPMNFVLEREFEWVRSTSRHRVPTLMEKMMSLLLKAAVGSLLLVQTAASYAQTGTAAGKEEASDHSQRNLYGGILVGGILVAVAAVAATGGNDGLADTSKPVTPPVVVPPVTTTTTTSTTTSTKT
jgi:hypothetical protein